MIVNTCRAGAVASAMLLLSLCVPTDAIIGGDEQVCNVVADYALGSEDYADAIRLHRQVLRAHPQNALAHYHLGFAQGMVGNRVAELKEYRQAKALGLRNWDLFLNMGRAELEAGELEGAENSLSQAVSLGPDHPESHFNLALVYELRADLTDAEREVLASLHLDSRQLDARNLLGVVYAQRGETARAASVWQQLTKEAPNFTPARTNLAILRGSNAAATSGCYPYPAAAVEANSGAGRRSGFQRRRVPSVGDDRSPCSR